jgi:alkylation response protein AidB-like acyl-CoA dehydrogenase
MVDREIWRIAGQQGFLVPAADSAYGGLGITDLRYAQDAKEVSHA